MVQVDTITPQSKPWRGRIGDTFNAIAGCDKTIGNCAGKFGNAVNFRGEPYVPGMDKMLATASTQN
jgi:uncharacterized phage protein (TIGR02218 family)